MKIRKNTAAIISLVLCFPLLTACGNQDKSEKNSSSAADTSSIQESQTEKGGADAKMHTLIIRDSLKNNSMTATFINSVSGASEDIAMTKSEETNDSFIYTCQADTNLGIVKKSIVKEHTKF